MRRKAAEAATLARRWFMTTLGLALALVLGGSWYRALPVEQHRSTGPAADRGRQPDGRWRPRCHRRRARDRRDRRAGGPVQRDGGADSRASPVRSREDPRGAANGRGDGRLAVRPGRCHRWRRPRAADQPRRRSAVRARRAPSSASPRRTSRTTLAWRGGRGRARIAAAGRQRRDHGYRAARRRRVERSFRQRTTPMRDIDGEFGRRRDPSRRHDAPARAGPPEVRVHCRRVP